MTPAEFIGLGFLLLAVVGWWQALTSRREHPPEEFDLPSAYQLRAWEKQRLVRGEANRRLS